MAPGPGGEFVVRSAAMVRTQQMSLNAVARWQ